MARCMRRGIAFALTVLIIFSTICTRVFADIGAPGNVTAASTESEIIVTWDSVPDSSGYEVRVDGQIIDVGLETEYHHTGLNPCTRHSYRIRAKAAGNTSAWSNEIEWLTAPTVPDNLTADATENSITVKWDPANGATSYDLEIDGTIQSVTDAVYAHTGLQFNTQHEYRVRAVNTGGASNWSSVIRESTTDGSPLAPKNDGKTTGTSVSI